MMMNDRAKLYSLYSAKDVAMQPDIRLLQVSMLGICFFMGGVEEFQTAVRRPFACMLLMRNLYV